MTRVDVIVAVRNEQQSIPVFLDQLGRLPLPPDVTLKTLFIEDSSTDDTRPMLRRLAAERADVGYCTLAKGYGQALAVAYGIDRSAAHAMIMMDVDGSHPVVVIPEMIAAFRDGAQVVQCVRRTLTNRRTYRQIGAAAFQLFARSLTGVDTREQNIYYRLVSRDVGKSLLQPRYWHYMRFPLPHRPPGALRKIYVDTEERQLGASKYHFRRLARLAVDAVTSLTTGLRISAMLALLLLAAAMLAAVGWWPLGAAFMAAAVLWGRRWMVLHRADTLRDIEVLECANVP